MESVELRAKSQSQQSEAEIDEPNWRDAMWKLWTRDENVQPPAVGSDEFDSDKRALERVCDLIRHSVHVKVLYIEKPSVRPVRISSAGATRIPRRHECREGFRTDVDKKGWRLLAP